MSRIARYARIAKHGAMQFLPGHVGMRNRACYRHWTRRPAEGDFARHLAALGPDDICVDCGANQGVVTARLAAQVGHVYAFEPDPWTHRQLAGNVAHLPNVTLIQKAVGAAAGRITMYRPPAFGADPAGASLGTSIFARVAVPDQGDMQEVEVVDFAAFLRGLDRNVGLVKMDIEGAEVALLDRLLDDPVMARIGALFVETHELQFDALLAPTEDLRRRAAAIRGTYVNLDWH